MSLIFFSSVLLIFMVMVRVLMPTLVVILCLFQRGTEGGTNSGGAVTELGQDDRRETQATIREHWESEICRAWDL